MSDPRGKPVSFLFLRILMFPETKWWDTLGLSRKQNCFRSDLTLSIYNNYSPKWRWLVPNIYRGREGAW